MRVMYLTWGETPRSYGVFGNQIINQFVKTCELLEVKEAYFVSAVPLIHSGFVREKFRYFKELLNVKKILGKVKFIWIPIHTTQNFVNSTAYTYNLMHIFSHGGLLDIVENIKPDIIHCRSYHAAWAAIKVKKRGNYKYKVIFDGRDLWPEEMALKHKFNESSLHYVFLKKVEKYLLENSDCSVSVSTKMHDHYVQLGAKNDHCIFLSSEPLASDAKNKFSYSDLSREVNFCYLGALSDATWHKTTDLAILFCRLIKEFPKAKLTIITSSDYSQIHSIFSKFKITNYTIVTTKTIEELKFILSSQDFGLMSYFTPRNLLQKKLANVLLSIKAVEYFSAGLPMICNAYCGEIAQIIDNHKLGFSYFPEVIDKLSQKDILPFYNEETRRKCIQFAKSNFDTLVSAEKYARLYCDLSDS